MCHVCLEGIVFEAMKEIIIPLDFNKTILCLQGYGNYLELLAILIKVWMTLNLMVLVDKVLKVFESVDFFFMLSGVIAQKLKAHLSSHPITSVCIQAEF